MHWFLILMCILHDIRMECYFSWVTNRFRDNNWWYHAYSDILMFWLPILIVKYIKLIKNVSSEKVDFIINRKFDHENIYLDTTCSLIGVLMTKLHIFRCFGAMAAYTSASLTSHWHKIEYWWLVSLHSVHSYTKFIILNGMVLFRLYYLRSFRLRAAILKTLR